MSKGINAPRPFRDYDSRHYKTLGVVEGYTAWAPHYGDLDDRFDVDLLESSPGLSERVRGAEVIDLGCGTGRMGRWARRHRAKRVVGVDLTPAMLERAEARGVYDRLEPGSVTDTGLPAGSADGLVSSLVLCHVGALAAFFAEARRLLRPGGWLALVDYHPIFLYLGIPSHFKDPDAGEDVAVENHVHSFGQIFEAGRVAGLALRDLRERFVDDEWVSAQPSYERHAGMPITAAWVFDAQ